MSEVHCSSDVMQLNSLLSMSGTSLSMVSRSGQKPRRTTRRTKAAIRCRSEDDVNLHQALEAYSSLATTIDHRQIAGLHRTIHEHVVLSMHTAARRHRPLLKLVLIVPTAYPRRDGQAELTWVSGYIPT